MTPTSDIPLRARSSSGRLLAGTGVGPAGGTPVLFVAGAATGKSMDFGREQLDEAGIRLLTMDRPGMGESSFDDARTVRSTAEDYRAFVNSVLGAPARRVPVVANSQGSVFGLAIALSGWASSLTLVSPADEIAHPAIRAISPPQAVSLAELVRESPDEAAALLGTFTPERMEQMVLTGVAGPDREVYAAPAFLRRYRAALREGFANDGAAYVQDTLMAMRPWELGLAGIECDVTVLIGAGDLGHSPDHGATLASRIPGCRRDVIADAGGALLWTHARRVLDAVSES